MEPPRREPDVEYSFDGRPTAAREARRHLEALFVDPADPIADPVRLSASELVTNVVQHTSGAGVMRVWDPRPDVPLRLEVEDFDLRKVHPAAQPPEARSGRGLHIVRQLADAWGTFTTGVGKVVWAEFDRMRGRHVDPG